MELGATQQSEGVGVSDGAAASGELVAQQQTQASLPPATRTRNEGGSDSRVLKLKGLPYSTSEKDIIDFFEGYPVSEVAFVYEPDGRPSGLAFAEFATREDALKALSKNGKYLGDRYVRLLHVPKQEMEEQVRLGTLAIPGAQAKMRQKMMRGPYMDSGMRSGPYGADGLPGMLQGGPQGMQELGGGYGPMAGMMPGMPPNMGQHSMAPLQPGMGIGMHPGMLPNSMAAAEQQQPLQMGNPQSGLPGGMAPQMALAYQLSNMGISGPPRSNPMGGMQMPPGYGPAGASAAAPMAVIGTDSKTIKIRGLPFRATPLDIFNFFDSYDIIAESLQLGVDALGRPSGEAWLTFAGSDEALRAVRERNRHYLGNRYLELSLT